jgi:hypothetical protein
METQETQNAGKHQVVHNGTRTGGRVAEGIVVGSFQMQWALGMH